MTRARCAMILALASWTLLAGCSKKTEVANQETATTQETQTTHETTTSEVVPADSARVAAPTGMLAAAQPVDLSGNLGCGHCTFHVKNECSLAMKAQDGTVYLLNAGARQEELMAKRYDAIPVHVHGQMTEVEGLKVITTETVELH